MKIKKITISILIPLLLGGLGALLSGGSTSLQTLNKPNFVPPGFVFPIVWTILYILMGISSFLVYTSSSNKKDKKIALAIYFIQLVINSIWTLIFFKMKLYLFGTIIIILLIVLSILMILKFYKINTIAALLQLPYILWLVFAFIIAYNVYLMN